MLRQLFLVTSMLILVGAFLGLVPTHVANGQPAADPAKDKLRKERDQQVKKFGACKDRAS